MAIRYVDYINGNDSTGNGTSGSPYKTVQKAVDSPTDAVGGDQIRIAKTYTRPGSPQLSVDFLFEMYTATASGDQTTAVPNGTIVGNDDIGYYKFQNPSFSGGVTIWDLGIPFPFPDQTAGCFIPQMATTPAAGSQQAYLETLNIPFANSNASSRVTISGGWNLSNLTQDGETWLKAQSAEQGQMYRVTSGYFHFSKINFVGYYGAIKVGGDSVTVADVRTVHGFVGLDTYACYGTTVTNYLSSCDTWSLNANSLNGSVFNNLSLISARARPIYASNSSSNTFTDLLCIGSSQEGILLENSHLNVFHNVEVRNFGAYGIMFNNASGNKFYNTTVELDPMPNMSWFPSDSINGTFAISNFFEDLTVTANELGGGFTLDRATMVVRRGSIDLSALFTSIYASTTQGTELRIYQRDGDTDHHELYSYRGYIHTVTNPARSGLAWEMWPNADCTSSSKVLSLPPFQVALKANKTYTISCYVYLTSPCSARLFCRGNQLPGIPSDVTSSTMSTTGSWQKISLTVTPTETGILEVEVHAWGNAQGTETCVVDDLKVI